MAYFLIMFLLIIFNYITIPFIVLLSYCATFYTFSVAFHTFGFSFEDIHHTFH